MAAVAAAPPLTDSHRRTFDPLTEKPARCVLAVAAPLRTYRLSGGTRGYPPAYRQHPLLPTQARKGNPTDIIA